MEILKINAKEKHILQELTTSKRWVSWDLNKDVWWMTPVYGNDIYSIPLSTQLLAFEYENNSGITKFGIVIPAVNEGIKGIIREESNQVVLTSLQSDELVEGLLEEKGVESLTIGVYATESDSILSAIKAGFSVLEKEIEHFTLIENKKVPAYYDYFGWCTWDVFYKEISEEKILDALNYFQEKGITPGYMIIDDGWQDVDGMFLNSVHENKKFPNGLKSCISKIKEQFNIKHVGVWHALQGYWGGINEAGELAGKYTYGKNENIKSEMFADLFSPKGYFIHKENIDEFYNELYTYLSGCGVDMVKVDSQGSLLLLSQNEYNPSEVMKKYQEALNKYGRTYFGENVLYCMSHPSDVIYETQSFSAFRNSDDFFPKETKEVQLNHFYYNAMNNVFTSNFAQPDWDMFQTNHAYGEYHGLVRAISGGPLYICDHPKDVNMEILNKLIVNGNEVLRFESAALPFEDNILTNPTTEEVLFKVWNKTEYGYTFMSAHVSPRKGLIDEHISLSDMDGVDARQRYVLYSPLSQSGEVVTGDEKISIRLNDGEYKYVHVLPIHQGFATIGLVNKYNSYLAIKEQKWDGYRLIIELKEKGTLGYYFEGDTPIHLCVNGNDYIISEHGFHTITVE